MSSSIEIDTGEDTEQYDEIPWEHLMEDLARPRYNTVAIAVGVLVVGLLSGYLVARLVGGGDPAPATDTVTMATQRLPNSLAPAATTTTAAPPTPATTPPPAVLFSEADLMAIAGEEEIRAAAGRAEAFVRDYFTLDGSGEGGTTIDVLTEALGTERESDTTTYVEWARALVVEPVGPGAYSVTVGFQMLVAEQDRFVRQPERAVAIRVDVGVDLVTSVAGLPQPADAQTDTPEPLPGGIDQPAPQHVIDRAAARARAWGTEPELLGSFLDDGTWHIVMSVEQAGGRWPLQIDITQEDSGP